ncbi:MAG: serine/threonine protein kinase, partial [Gemmataceae bacterium]|nr:serine/threonine protein kinase [Gemmataceae bacterium]
MTPGPSDHPTQLGSYDVLGKIAEGGMGVVYKARHRVSGEVVAVKVVTAATARNPVTVQRFEREFLAAKGLDHPNVVRAIEYCPAGPLPFLVMEFVDGESLGQRVERTGALPEAEAVRLIAQVCDGLHRAHKRGLVHRDVKPDNVLVTPDGVAKLTDLGLVKEVDNDLNLTKTGRGLGTPHYMAPEQFRNAKGVDVRGDVYSLGATLYALVTGHVPFGNTNPLDCWMKKVRNDFPPPKELAPELSDRVDWAIRRAMSADPDHRPASCREFVEDLTGRSRAGTEVAPSLAATPAPAPADLWYLVYRDADGRRQTVKGSTDGIRKALRDGLLGDAEAILVGRSKTGQFTPLGSVAEFRDLVVVPAALPVPWEPAVTPSGRQRAAGPSATPGPRSDRPSDDA